MALRFMIFAFFFMLCVSQFYHFLIFCFPYHKDTSGMHESWYTKPKITWLIYLYIYHCIGVWNGNEWKRWSHFVELIKKKNLIKWNWHFYSAKRWQTLLWTTMKLDFWIGLPRKIRTVFCMKCTQSLLFFTDTLFCVSFVSFCLRSLNINGKWQFVKELVFDGKC